jgi:tetratricopeptide (TPR) repeat protein
MAYADVTLTPAGQNVLRLRGPKQGAPKVSVVVGPARGGDCGPGPTQDLVLVFEKSARNWLDTMGQLKGPCSVSATPSQDRGENMAVHLSYPSARGQLQTMVFETSDSFVVDHWLQSSKLGKTRSNSAIHTTKPAPQQQNMKLAGTLVDVFEDSDKWDQLVSGGFVSFDFNSPELDRFRWPRAKRKIDFGALPIERQALRVPFLDFELMNRPVKFSAENFPASTFDDDNLLQIKPEPSVEQKALLKKGLNYALLLLNDKEYLKALKAIEILEQGNLKNLIPRQDALFWAMKGYAQIRAGIKDEIPELFKAGLNTWRDGLRIVAGRGQKGQDTIEFMVLESMRHLVERRLDYAAASLLTWSDRYSWSDKTTERFEYLRGEVFYRLSFFADAQVKFDQFFRQRKAKSITSMVDRRLLSSAAFRMGDLNLQQGKFKEAVEAYNRAMTEAPSRARFSFESVWYPDEVRLFPEVLFNRAEALVRLGEIQKALTDLRAFIYVALNDPEVGLVFYRVGDLLKVSGAPREMVNNAWSECVFRVPETLGGLLCRARSSAEQIGKQNKTQWPRLIGQVEAAGASKLKTSLESFSQDDLEVFLAILTADSFLRANEPQQAMFRLEAVSKKDTNPYLKAWLFEYRATAMAGILESRLQKNEHRDLVATYEKGEKTFLIFQTRPELLYRVSEAYLSLKLLPQASEVWTKADQVAQLINRTMARPYDYDNPRALYLRAQIEVGRFAQDPIFEPAALGALKALEASPNALRLWIRYAQKKKDPGLELKTWRQLESVDHLSWAEIDQLVALQKKQGQKTQVLTTLEASVGVWFRERERSGVSMPPAALVFALFEARSEAQKPDSALAVAEYLSKLDFQKVGSELSQSMLEYKRGLLLKSLGRNLDARRSFDQAARLDPDGVWGRLAASAQKDTPSQ